MQTVQEMKLDPNTTLESFEAAIRQDERQVISGILGFKLIRPTTADIINAQYEGDSELLKQYRINIFIASLFAASITFAACIFLS